MDPEEEKVKLFYLSGHNSAMVAYQPSMWDELVNDELAATPSPEHLALLKQREYLPCVLSPVYQ